MRVLIDTHRLTDFFRGEAGVVESLEHAEEIWIPFVALAELQAGFLGGSRAEANRDLLQAFLRMPGVDVLYADRETVDVYARIHSRLRRAGTPIPTNDLWIAGLAVQHQLILITRDEHFARIPQVARG